MQRIIIDFKKLSNELKELLIRKYPEGYTSNGLITYKNKFGETIEAIELKTKEACYLIKINKYNKVAINDFYEEADDWFDHEDPDEDHLYGDETESENSDTFESELEAV